MVRNWSLALAVLCLGLWSAPAMAQSEVDDLARENAKIRAEIRDLERGGGENEAVGTELVDSVLTFRSDNFELKMSTRIQFRILYQLEGGDGENGVSGRDFANFNIHRAKTTFSGWIGSKEWRFKTTLAWYRGFDTGVGLTFATDLIDTATLSWNSMQEFNLEIGQDKLHWNWEEIVSSGSQHFAERSYANEVFNLDYAKGITAFGSIGDDAPMIKYWVGVYNGVLKGDTDFRNADRSISGDTFGTVGNGSLVDNDFMVNLRLETHPMGEVSRGMIDNRGEDSKDEVRFAVGVGVNWFQSRFDGGGSGFRNLTSGSNVAAATGRSNHRQETKALVLDGHFRWNGLSADFEVYYRHTEFHNHGTLKVDTGGKASIGDLLDMGFTFEVAYLIKPEISAGIRVSYVDADDFWLGSSDKSNGIRPDTWEMGVTGTYYLQGDNLKLTLDIIMIDHQLAAGPSVTEFLTGTPSRSAASFANFTADHHNVMQVRLQVQWIF